MGEIDTMNEHFNAEMFIESKWIQTENITEYSPQSHWNPKLYIENAINEPKEKIKYLVQTIGV